MALVDKSGIGSTQKIETELDLILRTVDREENVSLGSLAIQLNTPLSKIEQWAKILDKSGLALLEYPLMGNARLAKPNVETSKPKEKHNSRNLIIFAILVGIIVVVGIYLLRTQVQS